MIVSDLPAAEIIRRLDLQPHPEGGHFRETFRDPGPGQGQGQGGGGGQSQGAGRAASTAIYYLLQAGEASHWHRVDAVEVWHWYAGAPLALSISPNGHDISAIHLGPDIHLGQHPQAIVPALGWQAAVSLGRWTLVGCTVAPGFDFAGFEIAPPDWRPTPRR